MGYQVPNNPRFIVSYTDYLRYAGSISSFQMNTNLPNGSNFYRMINGSPQRYHAANGGTYEGSGFTESVPAFNSAGNYIQANNKYFDILSINPTDLKYFSPLEQLSSEYYVEWVYTLDTRRFESEMHLFSTIGILGHNLSDSVEKIDFYGTQGNYDNLIYGDSAVNFSINWNKNQEEHTFNHNGFSLIDMTDPSFGNGQFSGYVQIKLRMYLKQGRNYANSYESIMINSVFLGSSQTISAQPTMSLSMGRSADVIKQKTKAGHTIQKRKSTTIPDWGLPKWTLTGFDLKDLPVKYPANMHRQGRRKYRLNYAFLQDSDVLPQRLHERGYGYTDYNVSFPDQYGLPAGEDLYNKIVRLTANGTLPFIFSPNQENYPANFGVYKLDKSPSIRQTAYAKYDVDLSMTELY
tara:strand:- start:883 stop:2103 length:1221 start_codon:yes stop_codon:yes gene_type:complete